MRLFRVYFLAVVALGFGFGCADRPKLADHEDLVMDVGEPRVHRIQFPKGWSEKRPHKEPVLSRADAPGVTASVVVATRDWRWQYERATTRYPDAWAALEGMTEEGFKRKFEQGNHPGRERLAVQELQRERLGKEKVIFVDYTFTAPHADSPHRLKAYFVLHQSRWYSVTLSTNYGPPDLHLAEMQQAAATFAFDD